MFFQTKKRTIGNHSFLRTQMIQPKAKPSLLRRSMMAGLLIPVLALVLVMEGTPDG